MPGAAQPGGAADPSALQRLQQGYRLAYNLDHAQALDAMQEAARRLPDDPAPHRGLATISWLNILFTRGTVTADEYLGKLARKDVTVPPPPAAVAEAFHGHARRALEAADRRIARDDRDARAHYARASALALEASYVATIDGRVTSAFPIARRAYKAAERAIELQPDLDDARLILGTYRYIVASQALPTRLIAYVAGMDGDKERGLALIEEAARAGSEVRTDARFALILLYNRERRFDDALAVIDQLRREFPRNRLLWLEGGATALRAGRAADAEQLLTEGMAALAREQRPRMFGEDAIWRYNRGLARLALGHEAGALDDLLQAVGAAEAREWVRGRAHLELGKLLQRRGRADDARWQFEKAEAALARGRDEGPLREARGLLRGATQR